MAQRSKRAALMSAALGSSLVATIATCVLAGSGNVAAPPDTAIVAQLVPFSNDKYVLVTITRTTNDFPDQKKGESPGLVSCFFTDTGNNTYIWDHNPSLYKRSDGNTKIATYGFKARGGTLAGKVAITIDDRPPFGPGNEDVKVIDLPAEPGGPYPCALDPSGSTKASFRVEFVPSSE
jgi:hypothetical protein